MAATVDHKILLAESDQPTRWYNVLHDLPTPPPPVLHPGTGQPVGPDDLAPLFPMELIMQEVSQEQYVEIPPARCSTSTACGGRLRSSGRTGWRRRSAHRRGSTTSTKVSRPPARTSRTPPSRRLTTTSRPGSRS